MTLPEMVDGILDDLLLDSKRPPTLGIYAVCREVAAMLEPDETRRDVTYARPVTYVPGRFYLWPLRDAYAVDDMKPTWREEFTLRCALAENASHEIDVRDAHVTAVLESWVEAIAKAVRDTLSGVTFQSLRITAIDYETLVTLESRGFFMDLAGYRRRDD